MTQKDKVKELVGRGLHSYHTKSLQQIDRIEKKNKEQNHKISILTNELDNDYLTKTEEGSVVYLEHSKEGMIYLDELQGNTLVNYCTDGSKEMTLNGDIDLEGTFVTTTEGVDGGKIDVMCEGNTILNIYQKFNTKSLSNGIEITDSEIRVSDAEGHRQLYNNISNGKLKLLKPSTLYTVIATIKKNTLSSSFYLINSYKAVGGDLATQPVIIPSGTTGLVKETFTTIDDFTDRDRLGFMVSSGVTGELVLENGLIILEGDWTNKETPSYFEGMKSVGQDDENGHKIEILSTNSDGSKSNKKEILLNEPLRGLPNGVKDQIVKIGGKYFIERKCGEFVLTDSLNYSLGNTSGVPYIQFPFKLGASTDYTTENKIICNRINTTNVYTSNTNIGVCYVKSDNIRFRLTDYDTLDSFITWLNQGLTVIVYELVNPIYEPLEIEPTLNSYNDITHISNNSIIPCNMKIKNSGYNAIIKPSTLYTVALDTNKSGTIGMNLSGAKVTTTNNVVTITTPATLTDDSLRLYGKGIKGSKVRILEGDKTNWIPSHFEGMKSSFEDKFDTTDNTYKMEILMKNRNLFDCSIILTQNNTLADYSFENNVLTFNQTGQGGMCVPLYVKRGYKYYFNGTTSNVVNIRLYTPNNYGGGGNLFSIGEGVNNTNVSSVYNCNMSGLVMLRFWKADGISTVTNFSVTTEPIEDYVPNMSNKIQFSSIEPLRKWDRFVFKDGRLMIERYSGELILEPNARYWNRKVTYPKPNVSRLEANGIFDFDLENIFDWSHRFYVLSNNFIFKEGENKPNYIALLGETNNGQIRITLNGELSFEECMTWLAENTSSIIYRLKEPTYEEIPFELQKIILEGYENGTLFFDTNIPPTSTTTYAGETPIVKSVKLNKTEVLSNTNDINDNIVPYLMDMDYRIVCLQLQSENINDGVSMLRLFGGTYEMLQRDILSKRYSIDEYRYRLDAYLSANKITNEEYEELGEMLNE